MFWSLQQNLSDPQSLNSYSYANNNPINRSDASGKVSVSATLSAISSILTRISSMLTSLLSGLSSGGSQNRSNDTASPSGSTSLQPTITNISTSPAKTTTWDPVTDRQIKRLDSRVRQPATNFINNTESQLGVQLRVTDSYRSIEEQNKIYNSGVRPAVPGGLSYHNYGRAVDVAVVENGEVTYDKPISKEMAEIGESQGFSWGGGWNKPDYPHFEMSFGQSARELYSDYLRTR